MNPDYQHANSVLSKALLPCSVEKEATFAPFTNSFQFSWSANKSVGIFFELAAPAYQRQKEIQRASVAMNIILMKEHTWQTGRLQNQKQ